MTIATRPTKTDKQTDPQLKTLTRVRLALACESARNTCQTLQALSDKAGGLASLQALFPDGSDADDLVTAFNAARLFATELDPNLSIPDLT